MDPFVSFHRLIEISRGVGVVRKKFPSVGVVQIFSGTPWHCGDSEVSDASMHWPELVQIWALPWVTAVQCVGCARHLICS